MKSDSVVIVVIVVSIILLLTGGTAAVVMTFNEREKKYGTKIVKAFRAAGIDPAIGLAMARLESGFDPKAKNETGTDLARGGAYGLFQMTRKTADALGIESDPATLMDPDFNINTTIALTKQNMARVGRNMEDIAAAHNSGKSLANAPSYTRQTYVPKVTQYYLAYKARLEKGEFS